VRSTSIGAQRAMATPDSLRTLTNAVPLLSQSRAHALVRSHRQAYGNPITLQFKYHAFRGSTICHKPDVVLPVARLAVFCGALSCALSGRLRFAHLGLILAGNPAKTRAARNRCTISSAKHSRTSERSNACELHAFDRHKIV